ncbi:hypothetical protein FNU76_06540 [Chitinimonas arctica]|uniref:Uncharacterized protein n=1 Tax=Chitinimonas arctica TaxID=2594795 RepID=A0A516SCZ7_9NEIS|nr:hypothetical protein [Chitinimonas arctica]QDQ26033.1 hypothetical protein FNU76_06540 [Chitinimonas arctica]
MRAEPIEPTRSLAGTSPHVEAKPPSHAPPGFDSWLAHALAAEPSRPDPTLQSGPADFGLWGVTPDAHGRLDLDEVASNLRATLPAFAGNLGKVCRGGGIAVPPLLRMEAGGAAGIPALPFDTREQALQQLFEAWPGIARQFRRLMSGFGFVRCSDALRAYQRVIGRLGPSRLAHTLGQHGDAHASPRLALAFDGSVAWLEEVSTGQWRPLANLEQLSHELLDGEGLATQSTARPSVSIEQAFDPISARLRAARSR